MRGDPVRLLWRTANLAFVMTLLLAACASPSTTPSAPESESPTEPASSEPAETEAPADPDTVTMGVSANVLATPFFAGIDQGIFLDHGIELELTVGSGSASVAGLQAGEFDFVTNAWTTILPAIVQGLDAQLWLPVTGTPDVVNYDRAVGLVVGPGFTGDDVADLEGQTIAVTIGTSPEIWLRETLTRAGLDPDSDVTIVNTEDMLPVIQSEAAVAAADSEPALSEAVALVEGARILTRGGEIVDQRIALYATTEWLNADPDLVDRITAATMESMQWVRQNREEAAEIATRYLTGQDAEVLAAALENIDYDPRWSENIEQGLMNASEALVERETIEEVPNLDDILNRDRLNGAAEAYPEFISDLE